MSCPECHADEGHFAICSHSHEWQRFCPVRSGTPCYSHVCFITCRLQGEDHAVHSDNGSSVRAGAPIDNGPAPLDSSAFFKGDLYCPHCWARPGSIHADNCGKYTGGVTLSQCATYMHERKSILPAATAFLDSREPTSPNPKDLVGDDKLPLHLWPPSATAYGCLGMFEGKLKYGLVNYRGSKVIASIYVAAAKRHLDEWYEGLDYTDEGNPSLGNALATIAIIVDAIVNESLIDDRPYTPIKGAYHKMRVELTKQVKHLKELFAEKRPKHWTNK